MRNGGGAKPPPDPTSSVTPRLVGFESTAPSGDETRPQRPQRTRNSAIASFSWPEVKGGRAELSQVTVADTTVNSRPAPPSVRWSVDCRCSSTRSSRCVSVYGCCLLESLDSASLSRPPRRHHTGHPRGSPIRIAPSAASSCLADPPAATSFPSAVQRTLPSWLNGSRTYRGRWSKMASRQWCDNSRDSEWPTETDSGAKEARATPSPIPSLPARSRCVLCRRNDRSWRNNNSNMTMMIHSLHTPHLHLRPQRPSSHSSTR